MSKKPQSDVITQLHQRIAKRTGRMAIGALGPHELPRSSTLPANGFDNRSSSSSSGGPRRVLYSQTARSSSSSSLPAGSADDDSTADRLARAREVLNRARRARALASKARHTVTSGMLGLAQRERGAIPTFEAPSIKQLREVLSDEDIDAIQAPSPPVPPDQEAKQSVDDNSSASRSTPVNDRNSKIKRRGSAKKRSARRSRGSSDDSRSGRSTARAKAGKAQGIGGRRGFGRARLALGGSPAMDPPDWHESDEDEPAPSRAQERVRRKGTRLQINGPGAVATSSAATLSSSSTTASPASSVTPPVHRHVEPDTNGQANRSMSSDSSGGVFMTPNASFSSSAGQEDETAEDDVEQRNQDQTARKRSPGVSPLSPSPAVLSDLSSLSPGSSAVSPLTPVSPKPEDIHITVDKRSHDNDHDDTEHWVQYTDTATGRPYFVNSVTGETQWTDPNAESSDSSDEDEDEKEEDEDEEKKEEVREQTADVAESKDSAAHDTSRISQPNTSGAASSSSSSTTSGSSSSSSSSSSAPQSSSSLPAHVTSVTIRPRGTKDLLTVPKAPSGRRRKKPGPQLITPDMLEDMLKDMEQWAPAAAQSAKVALSPGDIDTDRIDESADVEVKTPALPRDLKLITPDQFEVMLQSQLDAPVQRPSLHEDDFSWDEFDSDDSTEEEDNGGFVDDLDDVSDFSDTSDSSGSPTNPVITLTLPNKKTSRNWSSSSSGGHGHGHNSHGFHSTLPVIEDEEEDVFADMTDTDDEEADSATTSPEKGTKDTGKDEPGPAPSKGPSLHSILSADDMDELADDEDDDEEEEDWRAKLRAGPDIEESTPLDKSASTSSVATVVRQQHNGGAGGKGAVSEEEDDDSDSVTSLSTVVTATSASSYGGTSFSFRDLLADEDREELLDDDDDEEQNYMSGKSSRQNSDSDVDDVVVSFEKGQMQISKVDKKRRVPASAPGSTRSLPDHASVLRARSMSTKDLIIFRRQQQQEQQALVMQRVRAAQDARKKALNLLNSAPCPRPSCSSLRPIKGGCLEKQGSSGGSWKSYLFILSGKYLYYYKTARDSVPRGCICLVECSVTEETKLTEERQKSRGKQAYCFSVFSHVGWNVGRKKKFSERRYHFAASTYHDMNEWMFIISKTGEWYKLPQLITPLEARAALRSQGYGRHGAQNAAKARSLSLDVTTKP